MEPLVSIFRPDDQVPVDCGWEVGELPAPELVLFPELPWVALGDDPGVVPELFGRLLIEFATLVTNTNGNITANNMPRTVWPPSIPPKIHQ